MKQTMSLFLLLASFSLLSQVAKDHIDHAWTSPMVFTNPDESFTIHIRAVEEDVLSITLYSDFLVEIVKDGQVVPEVKLLDDGQNGDAIAGDQIFSVSGITSDRILLTEFPYSNPYYLSKVTVTKQNEVIELTTDIRLALRSIEDPFIPEVYRIDDRLQYTSHVFNITHDLSLRGVLRDVKEAAKDFYGQFPDDKHFIAITRDHAEPENSWGGRFWLVKNEVTGIYANNFLTDNTEEYGSQGSLEGVIEFSPGEESNISTFLHEMNHRWASYLADTFHMSTYAHWSGVFDQPGNAQGGSGVVEIIDNGDQSFAIIPDELPNNTHSPIDLYLSGYISIDEVGFPINVLYDGTYTVFNNVERIYETDLPMLSISKEDFIKEMGVRSPDHSEERKEQHLAMIVMTHKLMTPSELSYFHKLMEEHEKTEGSLFSPRSYHESTLGHGKLITRLISLVSNVFEKDQSFDLKILPNPTSDFFAIQHIDHDEVDRVQLINTEGKIVGQVTEGFDHISIDHLPTGVYTIVTYRRNEVQGVGMVTVVK